MDERNLAKRLSHEVPRAINDRRQFHQLPEHEYNQQLRVQVANLEKQLEADTFAHDAEQQLLREGARVATNSAAASHRIEAARTQQLERTAEALRVVQRERDTAEGALKHCQQRAETLVERAQAETEETKRLAERKLEQAQAESAALREELGSCTVSVNQIRQTAPSEIKKTAQLS